MGNDPIERAAKAARKWTAERDRRIRKAVAAGESLRSVGQRAGLTHAAIAKIAKREP